MKKPKVFLILLIVVVIIVTAYSIVLSRKVAARILIIDTSYDDFLFTIYSDGSFTMDRKETNYYIDCDIPKRLGGKISKFNPNIFRRIEILKMVKTLARDEPCNQGKEFPQTLGGIMAKAYISGKYYFRPVTFRKEIYGNENLGNLVTILQNITHYRYGRETESGSFYG